VSHSAGVPNPLGRLNDAARNSLREPIGSLCWLARTQPALPGSRRKVRRHYRPPASNDRPFNRTCLCKASQCITAAARGFCVSSRPCATVVREKHQVSVAATIFLHSRHRGGSPVRIDGRDNHCIRLGCWLKLQSRPASR